LIFLFIPASCDAWGQAESLLRGRVISYWSINLSQEHGVHSGDVTYPECAQELSAVFVQHWMLDPSGFVSPRPHDSDIVHWLVFLRKAFNFFGRVRSVQEKFFECSCILFIVFVCLI
jgi:hypothetical protein